MKLLRLFCVAALFALAMGTSSAKADDHCGSWGQAFGLMNSYGSSGTMYGLGRVPVPPYFSLHPPVYYGYRLARPYGYSPYAAPAGVLPAEFIQAPKLIDNPFYVRPGGAAAPAAEGEAAEGEAGEPTKVTAAPAMIVNPYYVPAENVAVRQ